MPEKEFRNLNTTLQFSASTSHQQRTAVIHAIENDGKYFLSERGADFEYDIRKRELDIDEKGTITSVLQKVGGKLQEIGISDVRKRLPTVDQVSLFTEPQDDRPDTVNFYGMTDPYCAGFRIRVPRGVEVADKRVEEVVVHESVHMVMPHMAGVRKEYNGDYPDLIGYGLDRFVLNSNKTTRNELRGVFTEGLSVLFTGFYFNEPGPLYQSAYEDHTAFTIPFLTEFAKRCQSTPLDAFKRVFSANVYRDFSLMTELVGAFGKPFVKELNNFPPFYNTSKTKRNLYNLATTGGFVSEFEHNRQKFNQGLPVVFPGLAGEFYRHPLHQPYRYG